MSESNCLAQNGLTAIPTLFGAAATSLFDLGTATETASTTRRATVTGGSSSAQETGDSDSGSGGNAVALGAVLAAVGGAALAL